jgi:hypothetical protein
MREKHVSSPAKTSTSPTMTSRGGGKAGGLRRTPPKLTTEEVGGGTPRGSGLARTPPHEARAVKERSAEKEKHAEAEVLQRLAHARRAAFEGRKKLREQYGAAHGASSVGEIQPTDAAAPGRAAGGAAPTNSQRSSAQAEKLRLLAAARKVSFRYVPLHLTRILLTV